MANIITGTEGADALAGTAGDDVISALGDFDIIQITRGHDTIDGGSGFDALNLSAPTLALPAGPRSYTITADRLYDGSGSIDSYFTNVEQLYLNDTGTNDVTIDGGSASLRLAPTLGIGAHHVTTGTGDDFITIKGGWGSIDGGSGYDWFALTIDASVNTAMLVAAVGATTTWSRAGEADVIVRNVEWTELTASGGGLRVDASALATGMTFDQTAFADTIIGTAASDLLGSVPGSTGAGDVFTGGGGADTYHLTSFAAFAGATITDLSEQDNITLFSTFGAVRFIRTAAFSGVAGEVRYVRGASETLLIGDVDGDGIGESTLTLSGSFQIAEDISQSQYLRRVADQVIGTEGYDLIWGNSADQTIATLGGNDEIHASRGHDVIDGGAGNADSLWIHSASLDLPVAPHVYTITAGRAFDDSGALDTSFSGIERLWFVDSSSSDVTLDASGVGGIPISIEVWSGTHDVTASANDDSVTVLGGTGAFDGGNGTDRLSIWIDAAANPGMMTMTETSGVTTLRQAGRTDLAARNFESLDVSATGGALRLDASATTRAFTLTTTGFADSIVGGAGNNHFYSAPSAVGTGDVLTGGGGNDWYDFYTFAALNGATITDFSQGDQIDLHLIGNAHFIGSAAFSGVAGEIRYAMTAGQTQLIGDSNGDGVGDSVLTLANRAMPLRETYAGSQMLQAPNVITGTNARDILFGSTGDDDISALGGPDTVKVSRGIDTVDGGAGTDMLELDASTLALGAGPHGYVLTPGRLVDSSNAVDTSFVGVEQVRLFDLGGNDVTVDASALTSVTLDVIVRAGTHALTGSGGTDSFNVSHGGSGTVDGGAGLDSLVFSTDNDVNTNWLTVNQAGGATVLSQAGGPTLGARNVETLYIGATAGGLRVDASASTIGLNFVMSNAADVAKGGTGADVFSLTSAASGTGDLWTGGGGADLFLFAGIAALSGTITDLDATDTIQITGLAPNGSFIGAREFTGVEGQFRYVSGRGLTALLGDADGDMVADSILLITNGAFVLAETSPTPGILHIAGQLPPNDAGDNVVIGTDGVDYLDGGEGNDTIDGRGGDDVINGGDDDDQINGGAGNDGIHGDYGNDVLTGGAGVDFVYGDDGDDIITESGGAGDWLIGGSGNDRITASGGQFNIFGEDGDDRLTLTGGSGGAWVNGQAGNDVIAASGSGQVNVSGDSGDDVITIGGFVGGFVSLGEGNDSLRIVSGGGYELRMGEDMRLGHDRVVIQSLSAGLTIRDFDSGEQGDVLDLSAFGADSFGTGVLQITQSGADTLIQHVAAGWSIRLYDELAANLSSYNLGVNNPLFAPVGLVLDIQAVEWPTQLIGADGDDLLRGNSGDDTLLGSGGADRIEGRLGNDTIDGGSGNDSLDGGGGQDILRGGAGADALDGGSGIDTADYSGNFGAVIVNLAAGAGAWNYAEGDSYSGIENVAGTEFNDLLTGDAGVNQLAGAGGNDLLHGGAGSDGLLGGAGVDTADYAGDFGAVIVNLATGVGAWNYAEGDSYSGIENVVGTSFNDVLVGDDGDNLLHGGAGSDALVGGLGVDTADYTGNFGAVIVNLDAGVGAWNYAEGDSYAGIENVVGTSYGDMLQGDAANNRLTGGGGADTLAGGGGIDTVDYSTNFGAVWINLATGEGFWNDAQGDRIFGVENVQGSAYGDFLVGDAGANALFGGGGNDLLAGGAGADLLDGGAGNDTIDFTGNFGGVAVSLRAGQGNWNAAEGDRYVGIENIKGTSFGDILEGDANANILSGGGGEDLFVFGAGFGLDTLTDFAGNGAASGDRIQFGSGLFTGFADMMAHAQQQGGDVVITLDAGNVLQLVGVQLGGLTSGDFLF